MAKLYDYDLIVIGAGIGGLVSAVTATGLGKNVAIVEKGRFGGNCANATCIPSKTLIRISHLCRNMSELGRFGLGLSVPTVFDTQNVMRHIRSVIHDAFEKDHPGTFEQIGIKVLAGTAAFVNSHTIRIAEQTISAEKFIIATGTKPLVPSIPGINDIEYLTSDNLYQTDVLPDSMVILGAGVDALEYASAFGRMGVKTTVIQRSAQLLPAADRELVNRLIQVLKTAGIRLLTGVNPEAVSRQNERVAVTIKRPDGGVEIIQADRLLVASGRKPAYDDLALENAGVRYTAKGIITDRTLRTSTPNIYACGDIAGFEQLASVAEYQGIIAATNAFLPFKRKVSYRNSVSVIFTDPPLASLGLTEAQAHEKYGNKLAVYRFDYTNMRRALIDGAQDGIAKFLCDPRGRLVGVHILGEAAPEVIHEAQLVKALNKSLFTIHEMTHAYPTYAQALVGRASQLAFLDRMGRNIFVKLALWLLPGYENRLHLARERLAETHSARSARISHIDLVVEKESRESGEIHLTAEQRQDGACVIDLPESLTDHDDRPFLAASAWTDTDDGRQIILNFSRVRRMNGLGACMLVKLCTKARRKGTRIQAFGLSGELRNVIDVTGLSEAINIKGTETEAFTAANPAQIERPEQDLAFQEFLDAPHWAAAGMSITVPPMPEEALNLNLDGRRISGPLRGFGSLWQKIYRLTISDPSVSPEQAIMVLKQNFPRFQPPENRFYPSTAGIQPGEIVLINAMTPGGPVATGVLVLYADDRSFTFITPEGHPESGCVSFSACREANRTIVQILGLARASDPLYEAAFRLVGSRIQVRIWTYLLSSLAIHLGLPAEITVEQTCVDRPMQWSEAGNIWWNAQVRTLLNAPFRLLSSLKGSGDVR